MTMMSLLQLQPSTSIGNTKSRRRTANAVRRMKSQSMLKTASSRQHMYSFFFLFTFLYAAKSVAQVNGQEMPYAIVPKFDRTVSYRTNVCDRQLQVYNGTLAIPDALRGLNLTVSITNYSDGKETFFFTLNPMTIDEVNPGVFALVLDELSSRAGFTWRNSFIPYPPLDPITDVNQTWTDILTWAVHTFDISMERWAQTVERLEIPVSFPISWYDNSIVLGEIVQPTSQTKQVFYLWSFLDPFHFTLWLSLICSIAITGIVYYILELWNNSADERDLECKPIASIFYAAITFTGHYQLRPQTHPARLVGFSFTFWALIVGSAYTANLASFLVSPRLLKFKYSSIDKILQSKAHVCVQKGGAIGNLLAKLYPDLILVPKTPDEEIFNGLRYPRNEGGCDVLAHQFNTFEIYENLRETNHDCNLRSEKRIVEVIPAGLATAVDTGSQYCTSLISHVLDYHLTTMIDDGFLERMWKSQLDRIATVSCASSIPSSSALADDTTLSLTIQDVGGIFIFHVVLSFLAIMIATIQFYLKWKRGHIIDDNRTLSTAFGIAHAKQVIESSRLSFRDMSISSFRSSSYNNQTSKFQRSNPDFKNTNNNNENHKTTLPNGVDVLDATEEPSDEHSRIPTTTPTNSNSNDSPYHSEDLLEDELVA
jgi:Ligand-gated ion channel